MICPRCEVECDLLEMILINDKYVCMDCIKVQRQQQLDGWEATKTTQLADIQTKLTELNSISILNRIDMLQKIREIQDSILQLKYYTDNS